MRNRKFLMISILLTLMVIIYTGLMLQNSQFYYSFKSKIGSKVVLFNGIEKNDENGINIVIDVCGVKTLEESSSLIKSLIIFSKKRLNFIIFTDNEDVKVEINSLFNSFPNKIMESVSYVVKDIEYPNDGRNWRKLSKTCASFRLFLPDVLLTTDSVLYLDSDMLALDSVELLWDEFREMTDQQMVALALHAPINAYRIIYKDKIPLVDEYAVNSGVMLMNLTRMRQFGWLSKIMDIYDEYTVRKKYTNIYDQALINIILTSNRDKLKLLSCRWNFYDGFCKYGSKTECKDIIPLGIGIIHHVGPRKKHKEDVDRMALPLTEAFANYNIGTDIQNFLINPFREGFIKIQYESKCSKIFTNILRSFQKLL